MSALAFADLIAPERISPSTDLFHKDGEGQLHFESRLPTNIPVFKENGSRGGRIFKLYPDRLSFMGSREDI
jgi:hypothetical protein